MLEESNARYKVLHQQLIAIENTTTDKKLVDLRQEVHQRETAERGYKQSMAAIEAKIQAEIDEEVGWGFWMSYDDQEKVK